MKKALSLHKIVLIFFAFIAMMIIGRIIYSGKPAFIFLIWNLFLAWIPFYISFHFKQLHNRQTVLQVIIFLGWLLFFPNALYIITDLIHLDMETNVPKWVDAILLFTSAIIGLLMAFVSLLRVEVFLLKKFDNKMVKVVILALLGLGSFGVYLGRFLRWNSWDIIQHPFGLVYQIAERFIFPFQHLRTWGITAVLTAFFILLYKSIKALKANKYEIP